MIKDLFALREQEIFNTLKQLKDYDFVVIGGYAVNAYTLPRFSVDCDIVVKDDDELKKVGNALLKMGYKKEEPNAEVQYSESFSRYEKRLNNNFAVGMDILIHNVTDRMTEVKFAAEWVFENSGIRVLRGKTITEELKLRIINIDALLAMKIISCRSTDIRDVFMMLPNANYKEWVKSEIATRYNFKDRISKIVDKVNSKQFKDGLSGVYGRIDEKVFGKHKKAITTLLNK